MKKILLILLLAVSFNSFSQGHRRSLLMASRADNVDLSLVSYWSFDTDYTDQVGTNDGTPTSMSLVAGQVNDCADFSASTNSVVTVADSPSLSFGNGTTDSPFSVSFWVFHDTAVTGTDRIWYFNKRDQTSSEYQVFQFDGSLRFYLTDNLNANNIQINHTFIPTVSTWYNYIATYDGSGLQSGLKLYIDNVSVGITTSGGTYVAMENSTNDLVFGKASWLPDLFPLNGKMDEVALANKEWTPAEVTYIYTQGLAGLNIN